MKKARLGKWGRDAAAGGGVLVFFIMAFEVMIMISPFAFFFYSVFNPVFHWLDAYPATRWLTHFFLPHMVLPPTLPLKIIRISGSVLFVAGFAIFAICALQVYLGKLFKWGIAHRGIYRFVRHPQYSALGIWGAGMTILWPRFVVLVTLSIMFVLYYFLARDEERRMSSQYGDSYREYMAKTGMFLPRFRKRVTAGDVSLSPFKPRRIIALAAVVAAVLGTGFACRSLTLNSIQFHTRGNVTLISIMPEDNSKDSTILDAVQRQGVHFLRRDRSYLAYEMPADYIMQGMIANTGSKFHLYKRHHTVRLMADWVLHPFEHLRLSPFARMAKMKHADPAAARRSHCPLGISAPNMTCRQCDYRRVIFVQVDNPSGRLRSGNGLLAFDSRRTPVGYIDLNTRTGQIVDIKRVPPKTAWGSVPTPAI
ncbi:MAG: isoprenylcysteine carboxylmethyltransferase family protein [Acidobacteriota bacterium]|jgi:protein-S-isoprenylcysteine O-methyltransferase Ste14